MPHETVARQRKRAVGALADHRGRLRIESKSCCNRQAGQEIDPWSAIEVLHCALSFIYSGRISCDFSEESHKALGADAAILRLYSGVLEHPACLFLLCR